MLFVSYPHAESNRNRQNRNLKFYPLNYRGRFQPFYDRRIHSDNHANLIRFCYFSHKKSHKSSFRQNTCHTFSEFCKFALV